MILKEAKAAKGSGNPKTEFAGNLSIDQVIKITKMKALNLSSSNLKAQVSEVMGSCNSLGITVEGKRAKEAIADLKSGLFDSKLQ